MIQEDYVSFEIAKLLKEKGFPQEYDEYHSMVYNEEDYESEYELQRLVLETELVKAGTLSSYPIGVPEPKCYCPTLQKTMKWLREVHNLFIEIRVGEIDGKTWYDFDIIPINGRKVEWNHYTNLPLVELNSYEEAVELALKYCLEKLV